MNPRNFSAELKRRHVYRVAVAYAVVAWLLIQIATSTFPVLEIPIWATRLVIALALLCFPIALIFAWAFELTPEGLKRAEDVAPGSTPQRTGMRGEKSVLAAGEDHFVRALVMGNVATVAALCGRNEEALVTLDLLAGEPGSFMHLGKLRRAPEWDALRANARFQKLLTDAEAAIKAQANK